MGDVVTRDITKAYRQIVDDGRSRRELKSKAHRQVRRYVHQMLATGHTDEEISYAPQLTGYAIS